MKHPIFDKKYKTDISFEMYKNLADLPEHEKVIYDLGFPYFTILVYFVICPFLPHIVVLALNTTSDIDTKFLHQLLFTVNISTIIFSLIIYKIKGKVRFILEKEQGKSADYKFIVNDKIIKKEDFNCT